MREHKMGLIAAPTPLIKMGAKFSNYHVHEKKSNLMPMKPESSDCIVCSPKVVACKPLHIAFGHPCPMGLMCVLGERCVSAH